MEVILQDKSLHEWLETQDAESQQIIADSMARVAEIETQLGADSDADGSLLGSQNSDLKKRAGPRSVRHRDAANEANDSLSSGTLDQSLRAPGPIHDFAVLDGVDVFRHRHARVVPDGQHGVGRADRAANEAGLAKPGLRKRTRYGSFRIRSQRNGRSGWPDSRRGRTAFHKPS